jgi:branched-chain amino acid transport system permease protein
LNGVVLGGTYALLGIGLTLIFGIMRVVNFTHGELYAFGAYLTYLFVVLLHLNFFVSILLAALAGFALGGLIELVLLRPLGKADIDTVMLVMIGAWIAMQNAEQLVWGGVALLVPSPFAQTPVVIGPVSVLPLRLFVVAATFVLLICFHLLINRTRLGIAMRATFQDRDAAALMGVNVSRIYTLTFALGSGLAAIAGALLGPIFLVNPTMGDLVALKAFAIVILGGLGNIFGATIGGFVLALVEEFGAGYLASDYRDALGFVMIILVLSLRPQGFFAIKGRIG